MLASMASRRSVRLRPSTSSRVNSVRTPIIPQPISTPTAAGMTAPNVGITVPTALPIPLWASGISATCGCTNGIDEVSRACSRVLSSSCEAQLSKRKPTLFGGMMFLPAPLHKRALFDGSIHERSLFTAGSGASLRGIRAQHKARTCSRVESGTRQNGCAHDEDPIERNLAHASELFET